MTPAIALPFIELGLIIIGLALIARLASRWGFSAIPLYLLAGLAFGNGGLLPLQVSQEFVHLGAEMGVVLLLYMLGLEYSSNELTSNLRSGLPGGLVDFLLNFIPGLAAGLLLGWEPLAAVLLGGVTYISSSGVAAKVLSDLKQTDCPETPIVISILVLEDLAMAVYLPLMSVLLIGQTFGTAIFSIALTLIIVGTVLFFAVRYGHLLSQLIAHQTDEVILFSTFGLLLLAAGLASRLQISAAVAAFLVGVAISGPVVERTHKLLSPFRDLFAAIFFLFFGLQIDPASLPPVLPIALSLGVVTAVTKFITGWFASRRAGLDRASGWRAGAVLVARGEFSIVIAGLGVAAGIEPSLGALSAAYVLFLAVLGPVLARLAGPVINKFIKK